jgi:hypothetical protein
LNGCDDDAHLEMAIPLLHWLHTDKQVPRFWEWILFSSGGALELKKCFWYLVYWQWVYGHPQMAPNNSCPGIIALTSGNIPNYTVIPRFKVCIREGKM